MAGDLAALTRSMKTLLIVLLVAWAAIAVIGFVVEALLWLAAVGIVLFAGTVLFWWARGKMSKRGDAGAAA